MTVEGNKWIVQAFRHPRQGWEEQFAKMAIQGDDQLFDETFSTQWDEEEWTWFPGDCIDKLRAYPQPR